MYPYGFTVDGLRHMILLQSLKIGLKDILSERVKNKTVVENAKTLNGILEQYMYKDLAGVIIEYSF